MRLRSHAFQDRSEIPQRYTCDGDDVSPPLAWDAPPKDVRSFVVLCDDPDAPGGTWHHWAAYDIPAELSALAEGAVQRAGQQKFKQAINDFQRVGYGGPCPPHLHGLHHYHFRLLALSVYRLKTGKNPSCREIERAARKHVIAEAVLVGVYER
jgi:Raf kinase inhibitor-like YbhB/YbcL family protein